MQKKKGVLSNPQSQFPRLKDHAPHWQLITTKTWMNTRFMSFLTKPMSWTQTSHPHRRTTGCLSVMANKTNELDANFSSS
jgi:hypothetical protein